MCGRYYVDDETAKEIEKLIQTVDNKLKKERLGYDIHPSDTAPVLTGGLDSLKLSWQRWGFPGFQGKGVIFNARSETVLEKRLFSDGIRRRRAVIPAAWFYEWNRNKEKITFLRHDRPVIYMAGFYSRFEEEDRFVILTTKANQSMIGTHDRMPLVLEENELKEWVLNDSATEKILGQTPVLLKKRAEYEQQTLF
ncbi:SOS response-associated peptidase family protein [Clostridium sp. AM58-1XD]|uniref:SOS response-associated peptidase n=1 Tax=Clostridium sp. AM58-1XD TaxID=2292307 RepID=UPI000E4810D8|nr:SOS response-associated peptidase family protein [Clostridium sp. AM58-1XD]RGZ01777.1 SOS response-associated peptidase [Clostridium sp. AM58-1XD]